MHYYIQSLENVGLIKFHFQIRKLRLKEVRYLVQDYVLCLIQVLSLDSLLIFLSFFYCFFLGFSLYYSPLLPQMHLYLIIIISIAPFHISHDSIFHIIILVNVCLMVYTHSALIRNVSEAQKSNPYLMCLKRPAVPALGAELQHTVKGQPSYIVSRSLVWDAQWDGISNNRGIVSQETKIKQKGQSLKHQHICCQASTGIGAVFGDEQLDSLPLASTTQKVTDTKGQMADLTRELQWYQS